MALARHKMGVVFQSDALGNRVHLGVDLLYLENKRAFLLYDPVCMISYLGCYLSCSPEGPKYFAP